MENIACGIDPGIANTGFAIVERLPSRYRLLRSGCIRTASSAKLGNRLDALYIAIQTLLTEYRPRLVALESVFFNRNVSSCISTGGVIAICELASVQAGIAALQIKPQLAKRAVTGKGTASKRYVNRIVNRLLRVSEIQNHHEADAAAAIAITTLFARSLYGLARGLLVSTPYPSRTPQTRHDGNIQC